MKILTSHDVLFLDAPVLVQDGNRGAIFHPRVVFHLVVHPATRGAGLITKRLDINRNAAVLPFLRDLVGAFYI